MRAGLALGGGLVAAASLGGCAILGIEDPNAKKNEVEEDPGLVDFEGVEIRLNLDPSTWSWSVFDNSSSSMNARLVVGIPASAMNNDTMSRVLNGMYCKVYGPDNLAQEDLSTYYYDDLLKTGKMNTGSSASGILHVLYTGAGTYMIQFDNLLGRKTSVQLTIEYNPNSGVNPFPSYLSWENAATSIHQGESFDAGLLTYAFTTDTSTYVYQEVWLESGAYEVVGVPLRISNHSNQSVPFSSSLYQMYSPEAYALSDASWAFADSAASTLTNVVPNQTAQGYLYFPYEYASATYYCVFNNNGVPVVASVWIP